MAHPNSSLRDALCISVMLSFSFIAAGNLPHQKRTDPNTGGDSALAVSAGFLLSQLPANNHHNLAFTVCEMDMNLTAEPFSFLIKVFALEHKISLPYPDPCA
jgi:hypothetical protein